MNDSLPDRPWRFGGLWTVFLVLVPLALMVRGYLAYVALPDKLIDDSYITLRYAANLAEGKGFVYNPGENVWGTTTPLQTLILALAAVVCGVPALEFSAVLIGLAASAAFWLVLVIILEEQRVPRPVSAAVLLMVLFGPAYVSNSVSGMETPLVLALMALSFYLYTKDRPVLLGIVFGLLLLARIDTLLWIGAVGGAFLWRHRRENRPASLAALAAFGLVALPWHVYAYVTFHSLIPQSMVGKTVSNFEAALSYPEYVVKLCRYLLPAGRLSDSWVYVSLVLAVLLTGSWVLWKEYPGFRPLVVFFFGFAGSFTAARAPMFRWYFPPLLWVVYLLSGLALYALWQRTLAAHCYRLVRWAPWGAVLAAILVHSLLGSYRFWQEISRGNIWADLGSFLTENTTPDRTIFLEHIGLIGFRSRYYVIDDIGLVSPEIASLRARYPERWLTMAIAAFKPDILVLYSYEDPRHAPERWAKDDLAWFDREYRLVADFPTEPISYVYFRGKGLQAQAQAGGGALIRRARNRDAFGSRNSQGVSCDFAEDKPNGTE
jgi:hypothetical protein